MFRFHFGNHIKVNKEKDKKPCPLDYIPLSRWDPSVSKDMLLTLVDEEGEIEATKVEHSKWVST